MEEGKKSGTVVHGGRTRGNRQKLTKGSYNSVKGESLSPRGQPSGEQVVWRGCGVSILKGFREPRD